VTIGDHVRARRLDLGLTQEQLAKQLEVTESTVNNWERGRSSPDVRAFPRVLSWLGYDPRPEGSSLPERVAATRRGRGLSQREFAAMLGTDQSSVARWETGRARPSRRYAEALDLLQDNES
jgi:transcriptional regulator with XRE-family HTH domain